MPCDCCCCCGFCLAESHDDGATLWEYVNGMNGSKVWFFVLVPYWLPVLEYIRGFSFIVGGVVLSRQ